MIKLVVLALLGFNSMADDCISMETRFVGVTGQCRISEDSGQTYRTTYETELTLKFDQSTKNLNVTYWMPFRKSPLNYVADGVERSGNIFQGIKNKATCSQDGFKIWALTYVQNQIEYDFKLNADGSLFYRETFTTPGNTTIEECLMVRKNK